MTPRHKCSSTMAKRVIRVEVEADLHEAILQEASKQGMTKEEVVRICAEKFLSKVYDTSKNKTSQMSKKPKRA
jgi:tRNA/tmRNA/rRNA uracil-C5-methylase (TrmA/RlmC/RlmD family)